MQQTLYLQNIFLKKHKRNTHAYSSLNIGCYLNNIMYKYQYELNLHKTQIRTIILMVQITFY